MGSATVVAAELLSVGAAVEALFAVLLLPPPHAANESNIEPTSVKEIKRFFIVLSPSFYVRFLFVAGDYTTYQLSATGCL